MTKDLNRYIELICCDMDIKQGCLIQNVPCEECPYNEYIEDTEEPCWKRAHSDLEDLWKDERDE